VIRYNIVQGDKTTAGGEVFGATDNRSTLDGVPLALEGDGIYCPACETTGQIVCVGPRQESWENGRKDALDNDLCVCECEPSPRLLYSKTGMFHQMTEKELVAQGFMKAPTKPASVPVVPAHSQPSTAAASLPSARAATVSDQASAEPRTGITLRIGVFFDGTQNNAANTLIGEQCRASTPSALGMEEID
jgi:uncharacterized Zn-binding protein involved in type VI secretion